MKPSPYPAVLQEELLVQLKAQGLQGSRRLPVPGLPEEEHGCSERGCVCTHMCAQ